MCLIRKQCSYMVEMCIRCLQVEKKGSECEIIGISKSGSKRTNCCAPWPFVLKRRGQGVRGQNPALMVLADTKSFLSQDRYPLCNLWTSIASLQKDNCFRMKEQLFTLTSAAQHAFILLEVIEYFGFIMPVWSYFLKQRK